jgi:hypothetical protein
VPGLSFIGRGSGAPEKLHEAQSRVDLVLRQILDQGAQAFSVAHGSILEGFVGAGKSRREAFQAG